MCCKRPIEEKALTIPFFPEGWKFAFVGPQQISWYQHKTSAYDFQKNMGLVLCAPRGNRRYLSIEKAIIHNKSLLSVADIPALRQYIGLVSKQDQLFPDNPLIGNNFLWEWIDANNRPRQLLGKISACLQKPEEDEFRFGLTYEDVTLRVANAALSEFESSIPLCATNMLERHAIGGCQLFTERAAEGLYQKGKAMPYSDLCPFKWMVPQTVVDEMVEVEENAGILLPRRTLLFRGFEISLQVKQSLIPNAGYGVFVSCRSFGTCKSDALVLQPDRKSVV